MIKKLSRLLQLQFSRFLVVGGVGLAVDAGIFFIAHLFCGLILSRMISFAVAVSATWGLNRLFTFRSRDPKYKSEWVRYTMVNVFGGCLNFFGFVFLVHHVVVMQRYPVVALMLMSALVAVVNYFMSRAFAFDKNYAHSG